jgi:hypothetical protein
MTAALRRGFTRLYVLPFNALIAYIAVNSAISFFVHPDVSVTRELPVWLAYTWVVQYALGGLLMLAGLITNRANLEAAGCSGFIGGALVNAFTWAAVGGFNAWNTVLLLTLFAVAAWARLMHLVRRQVVVLTVATKVEADGH